MAPTDIQVRLALSDRNLQVVDEHVDVAVRIGVLSDSGLIATRVGVMRTVVCASPALLTRRGTPNTPDDLARLPCVDFNIRSFTPDWRFRSGHAEIQPRLTVSSAEAAVWAAIQGIGATRVLHYQCVDAVRDGALQIVLAEFELDPAPVHLIHVQGRQVPLKTRAFLDFAAQRLRRGLG